MKLSLILLPALISVAAAASAEEAPLACRDRGEHAQLVCGVEGCLRIGTRRICENAPQAIARHRPAIRRIDAEERTQRALTRLIASID